MSDIVFRFAAAKAAALVHRACSRNPGVGLREVLAAAYLADKAHLNDWGRPVFGATYMAMRWGPLAVEVYEVIKSEPLWLAEAGVDSFPWRLDGYRLHPEPGVPVATSCVSRSDTEAFDAALEAVLLDPPGPRAASMHGPDWQAARLGRMRYEDMVTAGPDREAMIDDIRETCIYAVV